MPIQCLYLNTGVVLRSSARTKSTSGDDDKLPVMSMGFLINAGYGAERLHQYPCWCWVSLVVMKIMVLLLKLSAPSQFRSEERRVGKECPV